MFEKLLGKSTSVLAGGVALNCVSNGKLLRSKYPAADEPPGPPPTIIASYSVPFFGVEPVSIGNSHERTSLAMY